jgi:hypothetical protein
VKGGCPHGQRVKPIPVRQEQYFGDDSSAILEIARRKGEVILVVD